MLELCRDIGDFFFALLQVPLDYILSLPWFPSWYTAKSGEEPGEPSSGLIDSADSEGSGHMNNGTNLPILVDHGGAVQAFRVLDRRHGTIRSVSDNQRPSVYNVADSRASHYRHSSTTSLPAYSEHPLHDPPRYSQTLTSHNGHQIWYPPTSACPASTYETAVSAFDPLGTAPEYHSPEWRTYPAFPSAYPPTPLPASAILPSSITPRSDHRLVSDSAYTPIPEDEQGFGEMLERVHEGCSNSMHGSSSSGEIPPGAKSCEMNSDVTRQLDEESVPDESMYSSEAGLSEDDLGTSLRTPHRPPRAMPLSAYSSGDSLTSAPTSTDNAPSLRTKTSSDSLSSDSSSLAGRKRAYGTFQGNAWNTIQKSHSRNATLRGKPVSAPIPQNSRRLTSEEEDVGDEDGSTAAKRQRVLDPLKRKSTVRPIARGAGNARKTVSSRSTTVHNRTVTIASQGTTRARAGSATATRERKSTHAPRHVMRGGPQGVIKSSSTSSSQSGTLKGRAY